MNLHWEQILREQERLIRLQPMVEAQLKSITTIDHVGIGVKEINGELSEHLCFRVYVKEKKAREALPPAEIIPTNILGIKTDVLCRAEVLAIADRSRHRPLRGGIQVRTDRVDGNRERLAGTLGVLVTSISSSSGKLMALTCEHVVAQGVHEPANPNAAVGMKVGQPTYSTCCCCVCGDIGTVFKVQKDANVDCALIDLTEKLRLDVSSSSMQNHIEGIGAITGVAQAVCFERVRKRGAGTEITEGRVVEVMFDGSQILVRATGAGVFADFGDSGAVLVNDANKIVGLLWAANRNVINFLHSSSSGTFFRKEGVANHIGPVMSALGITIAGQNSSGLGLPSANCGPAPSVFSSGGLSSSTAQSSQLSSGQFSSGQGSPSSSGGQFSSAQSGLSSSVAQSSLLSSGQLSSGQSGLSSSTQSNSSEPRLPPSSGMSSGSPRPSSSSSSRRSSSSSCGPSPNTRDYVGANKGVANLVGFKARITTRNVTLPCAPTATFAAFSTTWVGIVNQTAPSSADWHWAQMGFSTDRVVGSAAVTYRFYCEVRAGSGAAAYHMHWYAAQADGAHVFSGEVTQPAAAPRPSSSSSSSSSGPPAPGVWNFYVDGVAVHSFSHVGWATAVGGTLNFNTELQDHHSPVPGTAGNKCVFDQCAYKTRGSAVWTNAGLAAANLRNDDNTRHSISLVSGTSFESWEL